MMVMCVVELEMSLQRVCGKCVGRGVEIRDVKLLVSWG